MKTALLTPLLTLLLVASSPAQEAFQFQGADQLVTLNLHDEDLSVVLEQFAANYGLNIVVGPEVSGRVTINLYEVPVGDALEQVLNANGYTFRVEGAFLLVTPSQETGHGEVRYEPRVFFLNHVAAADVRILIAPLLSTNESVVAGAASEMGVPESGATRGNSDASREMLVVYASDRSLERVTRLLEQIDVPPRQVLVEAVILSVELTDNYGLGVDFSALGSVDFQALGGTSDFQSVDFDSASGGQLSGWLTGAQTSGFTTPGSDGLHIGILRNQVGMFIEALERVTDVSVLSNPKIVALNRQQANLIVGQKLGYQVLTTTETSTLQSVDFLEVGVQLRFRPFIADDGYIRLEVHPENSTGAIDPSTGMPNEATTEVTTNILVKSGNTAVIGGLVDSSMSTSISQVPLLGSLPWIGGLFRSTTETETKHEVVVLLTPHIVDDAMLASDAEQTRERLQAAMASVAASRNSYLRPSYARTMYAEAAGALAAGETAAALAKAEWGLRAMPADPDLAALAAHCVRMLDEEALANSELSEALEILEHQSSPENLR